MKLSVFISLVMSTVAAGQTCTEKSEGVKLMNSLLCGYDKTTLPVRNVNTTITVKVIIGIKHFDVDEYYHVLTLNTWTFWTWKDELLSWDPIAHSGIKELRIENDRIWLPDISMHSVGRSSDAHNRMPLTNCKLVYFGSVTCVPPTTYSIDCDPDLTRWPLDVQVCTSELAGWVHHTGEVDFKLIDQGISLDIIENNVENNWKLEHISSKIKLYQIVKPKIEYKGAVFTFKIQRRSNSLTATVLVPALVLAAMTLFMFLLDPMNTQRLNLGCVNVLGHCLYLQYVGILLPSTGNVVPLIAAFFRDSLLLLAVSLLATIILRKMLSAENPPPAWITSAVTWILESKAGQIFILSQLSPQGAATSSTEDGDGAVLVDNKTDKPKNNVWAFTAVLLDRVCFVVFCLTLFGLLVAFVP